MKEKLLQELIDEGYLKTPTIIEAFKNIDRADFVSKDMKHLAYTNQALPIGHGQTISQPLTVAFMLELLEPAEGENILDIGAGSGWQAALLSYIVSGGEKHKNGRVTAVERIPELKDMAENNISKYGFTKNGVTEVVQGDGSRGYEANSPYNKIIAAASGKKVPKPWKEQLSVGGIIVAPVESSIIKYTKTMKNDYKEESYFGFSFVPLIEKEDKRS